MRKSIAVLAVAALTLGACTSAEDIREQSQYQAQLVASGADETQVEEGMTRFKQRQAAQDVGAIALAALVIPLCVAAPMVCV